MLTKFKAIRINPGENWAVVLTTLEGDDHRIDGFHSPEEAQSWVERETGQRLITAWAA